MTLPATQPWGLLAKPHGKCFLPKCLFLVSNINCNTYVKIGKISVYYRKGTTSTTVKWDQGVHTSTHTHSLESPLNLYLMHSVSSSAIRLEKHGRLGHAYTCNPDESASLPLCLQTILFHLASWGPLHKICKMWWRWQLPTVSIPSLLHSFADSQ